MLPSAHSLLLLLPLLAGAQAPLPADAAPSLPGEPDPQGNLPTQLTCEGMKEALKALHQGATGKTSFGDIDFKRKLRLGLQEGFFNADKTKFTVDGNPKPAERGEAAFGTPARRNHGFVFSRASDAAEGATFRLKRVSGSGVVEFKVCGFRSSGGGTGSPGGDLTVTYNGSAQTLAADAQEVRLPVKGGARVNRSTWWMVVVSPSSLKTDVRYGVEGFERVQKTKQ